MQDKDFKKGRRRNVSSSSHMYIQFEVMRKKQPLQVCQTLVRIFLFLILSLQSLTAPLSWQVNAKPFHGVPWKEYQRSLPFSNSSSNIAVYNLLQVKNHMHGPQQPREREGGFVKRGAFLRWRGGAAGGGYEFIIQTPEEKKKLGEERDDNEGDDSDTNATIQGRNGEESSSICDNDRNISQQKLLKSKAQNQKQRKKVMASCASSSRQNYPISICSIQGKRAYMEDEYYNNEDGSFVAVMDGHGGSAVSRYIRQNLYARYLQAKTQTAVLDVDITNSHLVANSGKDGKKVGDDEEEDDANSYNLDGDQNNKTAVAWGYGRTNSNVVETEQTINDDGSLSTRISAIIPDFSELDYHTKMGMDDISLSSSATPKPTFEAEEANSATMTPKLSKKHGKKIWNEKLMDAPSSPPIAPSSSHTSATQNTPTLSTRIRALTSAFETIDSEVQKISHWSYQGSTAVAVLLCKVLTDGHIPTTKTMLISANVGDSRAVLCRAGRAIDLTRDHKPNDPMERARIESLGGRVDWFGPVDQNGNPVTHVQSKNGKRRGIAGVYRINRNLALSRAIGDRSERPLVSSQVEIDHIELDKERDEFVILATDGLWDVWDSQEAVDYCKRVMQKFGAHGKNNGDDSSHESSLERVRRKLSKLLVREALKRGSMDNITVVIVWLSQ